MHALHCAFLAQGHVCVLDVAICRPFCPDISEHSLRLEILTSTSAVNAVPLLYSEDGGKCHTAASVATAGRAMYVCWLSLVVKGHCLHANLLQ